MQNDPRLRPPSRLGVSAVQTKPQPKIFSGQPEILAVYCSDYRTRTALDDFLDDSYPNKGVDVVALPGGVWWVAALSDRMKYTVMSLLSGKTKFFQKVLGLLIKRHRLKEIIFFGHQDCSWYKNEYPNLAPADLIRQIGDDLLEAKDQIAEVFGKEIVTKGYIVLFDQTGNISFREIF